MFSRPGFPLKNPPFNSMILNSSTPHGGYLHTLIDIYLQCFQSFAGIPERSAVAMGPRTVGCDLISESATCFVQSNETVIIDQLNLLHRSSCGLVIELLPTFGDSSDHVLADGGVMRVTKDLTRKHDLHQRVSERNASGVDEDIARLQRQSMID